MAKLSAGPADKIGPGDAVKLDTDPPIAVFNVDGRFYATDDTCSHAESSLTEDGYIDGDVVECGFHFAKFDICTGKVLSLPAVSGLATFHVEVVDGDVIVDIGDRDIDDVTVTIAGGPQ